MKKHVFPLAFLLALVISCAEDQEVFFNDPSITVRFINADSLQKVNDSLGITNDSILVLNDTVNYFSDSLVILADSISVLNDSIENGRTEYEQTRDDLQEIEADFTSSLELVNANSTLLSEVKSLLTSVVSTIESGDVLISSITNIQNNTAIGYTDSATSYKLPLSMTMDFSNIDIEIDGRVFPVEITYSREEVVDEKRRIRVLISNIAIKDSGFDSVSCKSLNCENELPIKFYF